MEIRVNVDDDFMSMLLKVTGLKSGGKVVSESLMMFKWMVKEAKKGRIIFSAEQDGTDIKRVLTPALQEARKKGEKNG